MSAIVSPALSWASRVLAPRWGVTTTASRPNSGDSVVGSRSNTSSAAPAITPSLTASARAASSTMPPLAALITRRVGFAFTSRSRPISPAVSAVLGRWMVRKSDSETTWSSGSSSTPMWRARSTETYGSKAISRSPKARARSATSLPMRPKPTIPSVLSASSTPSHRLRSQRPATSAACACGTLRAWASNSAIVCSAADTMLLSGALTTITPRRVAASMSTLSSPMPARPTTSRSRPAASTSSVTIVAERMINAWAPSSASSRSAGDRPGRTSTSWPAERRRSSPLSAMSSVTRMRAIERHAYRLRRRFAQYVRRSWPGRSSTRSSSGSSIGACRTSSSAATRHPRSGLAPCRCSCSPISSSA